MTDTEAQLLHKQLNDNLTIIKKRFHHTTDLKKGSRAAAVPGACVPK